MKFAERPMYLLLTGMTISAVLLLVSAGIAVQNEKSIAVARQVIYREREPIGFVVREYNGKLALFRENSPRPYQVLDMEVWLLTEEDRLALKEGILVSSEQELRILLEDLDG